MAIRTDLGGAIFTFFGLLAFCGAGCSRDATGNSPEGRSAGNPALPAADGEGELRVQVLAPNEQLTGSSAIQRVDLGTVRQGESLRRKILIVNRTQKAIAIDRFAASCDCVKLTGLPLSIRSFSETAIEVLVDETHESEFHGDLTVDVVAYNQARRLFGARICLTVDLAERDASGHSFVGIVSEH